jgi:aspartyl-tRNA(Asn)/glutamyl-tRNA(Gln) amidotransferase subunit A
MRHLAPGFEPAHVELRDLAAGLAWIESADPLVGERVAAAAALFPRARAVEIPTRGGDTYAQFMREVADVHRELFAEHADLYGEDVRIKIERCLQVTDGEAAAAARARATWRAEAAEAMSGLDLLLTPTLPMVAPRRGRPAVGDLDVRERLISLTFPFDAFGWPALALPCGPAEDGLPASIQLAAPTGGDALVLAAGAALERALSVE